jgi:hypothetical protein
MGDYQILRIHETGTSKSSWEALSDVLLLADSLGGMVANLVQIVEHPNCLYDGKMPFTPLSEEIVGIDKYGKYTDADGLIFLTIHGQGVLTPNTLRKAQQVGYVGNGSANLDKIFPYQDVLSIILNDNFLPDGRLIEIIPYLDYKESGISDSGLLHGIVRTRDQAIYPDFNDIVNLSDNPQVITYCGGKKRSSNLFEAWKRNGQGGFHTRNMFFSSRANFVDATQRQLVATMANPIYGPCDGFYGCWPLSALDNSKLRYLILTKKEEIENISFEEYMEELNKFLPPGLGMDFPFIQFCEDYDSLESNVSFYKEILEYDIVKQEIDKYLLWNGEEYALLVAADLQVRDVSGKNSDQEKDSLPVIIDDTHDTDNIDTFYRKCRDHGIKVEEDNRKTDRSIIIRDPSGGYYEVSEKGKRE